jgi:hypothetical protein
MTIQVWCSFQFFQQSEAKTIPAMVSDGRMTTDIENQFGSTRRLEHHFLKDKAAIRSARSAARTFATP